MTTKIKYENSPPPSDIEYEEILPTPAFSSSRVQEFLLQGFLSVDLNLIHPRLLGIEREENQQTDENTTIKEICEKKRKALSEKECPSKKASCKRLACRKNHQLRRILPVESDESDDNSTAVNKPKNGFTSKSYLKKSKAVLKDSDTKKSKLQTCSKYRKGISAHDIYKCMDSNIFKGLDHCSRKSRRSRSTSTDEISFMYRRRISPRISRRSSPRSPEFRMKREVFSSDEEIYYLGTGKRNYRNDEDRNSKGRSPRRKRTHTSCDRRSVLRSPELRVKREVFSSDDEIYYLGRGKRNYRNDEDRNSKGPSPRRKRIRTSCDRRSVLRSPELRVKREVFSSEDEISYLGKSKNSVKDEDGNSRGHSPKREPIPAIKTESGDTKDSKELFGPNSYYCPLCKLSLSSELTWKSHLLGQRHAKAVRAQSVHEVARSSLSTTTFIPVLGEGNRHDKPPPLKKRVELRKAVSNIQAVCNDHQHRHPVMGLKYIWEIRGETETAYYCNLCDAPCGPSSVMPHLEGFKHKIQCLKEYFPRLYDKHKDDHKKQVEKIIKDKFSECFKSFKREKVRVFKDIPTTKHSFINEGAFPDHQPGPSWKTTPSQAKDETMIIRDENGRTVVPSNQEFLDTQYADFHCTLCDSHMNNLNMWEAHIRGKRHLKNEKKAPEGIAATNRYVRAPPGTVSNLVKQIEESCVSGEIIVGLKYIRENQGKQGNQYNCFPCGGCCSDLDIVDHILGMKHKIKYLEKMEVDGYKNSIMDINNIQVSNYYREQLVDAECQEMMRKYGRGKPKIYYIKRDLLSY